MDALTFPLGDAAAGAVGLCNRGVDRCGRIGVAAFNAGDLPALALNVAMVDLNRCHRSALQIVGIGEREAASLDRAALFVGDGQQGVVLVDTDHRHASDAKALARVDHVDQVH
ncbi:hypothetical protein [Rhodopseudomonas palustris]|uniref:hypothetical protein n=1 Tax=Rhodopseudomonas palustris TaxID=1076 RepID=UPI0021F2C6C5|nr:hypothetical protein [Rhodopseudomonas palustris]UYO52486.1 hypothetical protein KQX61_18080 [Rhodopseudomonas palustris]